MVMVMLMLSMLIMVYHVTVVAVPQSIHVPESSTSSRLPAVTQSAVFE